GGRGGRVLVAGEALVDHRGRLVEAAGQARGLEGGGDLLHLADEAPRLARVVAGGRLGSLGQLRLRAAPLREQRVVHALGGGERAVADRDGLEGARLEQSGGALGLAAREVEPRGPGAARRWADQPSV